MDSATNYSLNPWKSDMGTQRTQCFGADVSPGAKLYALDGETLDRRPVFLSLAVPGDLKGNVRQYACTFSHAPDACKWLALPGAGVHFRMAAQSESRRKIHDLLRAEREAFVSAPAQPRWLGIACSDRSFRLVITFSREQALDCKAYALTCLEQCAEANPCRSMLQSLAGSFDSLSETNDCSSQLALDESRLSPFFQVSASSDLASSAAKRVSVSRTLSKQASAALRDFAKRNGFGLETLFAASWAHLLSCYSGEDPVPVWRRNTQAIVGPAAESLARVPVSTGKDQTVYEWLCSISRALESEDFSCGNQVDTILIFSQSASDPLLQLLEEATSRVILRISDEPALSFSLSSMREQLSGEFARALLACLETIVCQLPSASLKFAHELDLIPADLRARYLAAPRGAATSANEFQRLVHDLIEEQSLRTPHQVAAISNAEKITYAQLDRRANQLARRLLRMGAGPDQPVAVHLGRSIDLLVAILGILKAGAAYLPLDASLPGGRVETVLRESEAPIVITSSALCERFSPGASIVVCLDSDRQALEQENGSRVQSSVRPENLVYITYTSGSTGKPKGAMIEHRQLIASFGGVKQMYGSARGVWLAAASISFDISISELIFPLTTGSTIVLHEGDEGKPLISGPGSIPEQMIEHRVTYFQATPALVEMLLSHPSAEKALRGIRKITVGGEAFPPALAATLIRLMPGAVLNAYGPTETTISASSHPVRKAESCIPIGRPLVNARFYVLDKWNRLLPPLAPGELYIGGPIVARGYHRRPDLTLERFLRNPFVTDTYARFYRTGDIVRLNTKDEAEFITRTDAQVKIHGYRIELGEIEAALTRHSSVQQAAVLIQNAGNDRRLVGYVRSKPGTSPSMAELREHLRKTLPEYMVPSVLVSLEQFPINGSGKIDRARLPEPGLSSPGFESGDTASKQEIAPPVDKKTQEIETDLCNWCKELLGATAISPGDDFFEIGGQSLIAAQLVQRIAKKYNVHLRLSAFVRTRKLRAIAQSIQSETSDGRFQPLHGSVLVTIRAAGSKPPVFLLAGIGGSVVNFELLARSLDPDRPVYAIETDGLDQHNEVLTKVEDMASVYLSEIRKIQPSGPYHLAGYSFGGVVAYEMARQLKSSCEQIGVIALIDTSEHHYQQQVIAGLRPAQRWQSVYKDRLRRLIFGPRRFDALAVRLRDAAVRAVFVLFARLGRSLPLTVGGSEDRNFYALDRYIPQPYEDPIHLFRCMDTDRFDGDDPLLGWGRLAKEIIVRPVPGQHGVVMRAPYVHSLGKTMEACLSSAEQELAGHPSPFTSDSVITAA
ncbi:MAG: amino acid adenylation domain-containing protein [Bryobacteraceae bacterium]